MNSLIMQVHYLHLNFIFVTWENMNCMIGNKKEHLPGGFGRITIRRRSTS